jgi:hypothetical protein
VMPRGVADLFACWSGKVGNSESGAIWKAVPHCLMWCLWHKRNSQTFSGAIGSSSQTHLLADPFRVDEGLQLNLCPFCSRNA